MSIQRKAVRVAWVYAWAPARVKRQIINAIVGQQAHGRFTFYLACAKTIGFVIGPRAVVPHC